MARKFLVFQHTPWEGPGRLLVDAARQQGAKLRLVRLWQDEIPTLAPYDGLIVLGGSPNVDQEAQYPFLRREKEVIRQSIAHDRPYLGFCLGHQLLAHVMGARVGPNFKPSVGFIKGYQTHRGKEHPVFAGLPRTLHLFKWHGQAVQEPLPKQMEMLLTSADCQVEAVAVRNRPHILGVQADIHAADPRTVSSWLSKDAKWLASLAPHAVDPQVVSSEASFLAARLAEQFQRFFAAYLRVLG